MTMEVDGIEFEIYYCFFGEDDSLSRGVVAIATRPKLKNSKWSFSSGRYSAVDIDDRTEEMKINWTSDEKEIAHIVTVSKDVTEYRIKQHTDKRQVGIKCRMSPCIVPDALRPGIRSAANSVIDSALKPGKVTKSQIDRFNRILDAAEAGGTKRTKHATTVEGIKRRMQLIQNNNSLGNSEIFLNGAN